MSLFELRSQVGESTFQKEVLIPGLKKFGYLVNYVFRMKTSDGRWLTSTTLKGLPDIMAVGHGCTLWIEVKGPHTAISAAQVIVLDFFAGACPTNRCWLLQPTDDWQMIANWIARPLDAPQRYGWSAALLDWAQKNPTGKTTKR
jgi:hypothetical protein